MTLTPMERMLLLNVLPSEGDFGTLKIVRELRESLSFSEEEHETLKVQRGWKCRLCQAEVLGATPIPCPNDGEDMAPTGQMVWDDQEGMEKEFALGAKAKELIVTSLKTLNDDKKLSNEHFSLYEKFIEG